MSESSSSAASVISHYLRKMERHSGDPQVLLHCLNKLDRVQVNIALLQETGIGRTVNSLKKSEPEVAERARQLVAKWKEVVAKEDDEEEKAEENHQQQPEEVVEEEAREEDEDEEQPPVLEAEVNLEEEDEEPPVLEAETEIKPKKHHRHHHKDSKRKEEKESSSAAVAAAEASSSSSAVVVVVPSSSASSNSNSNSHHKKHKKEKKKSRSNDDEEEDRKSKQSSSSSSKGSKDVPSTSSSSSSSARHKEEKKKDKSSHKKSSSSSSSSSSKKLLPPPPPRMEDSFEAAILNIPSSSVTGTTSSSSSKKSKHSKHSSNGSKKEEEKEERRLPPASLSESKSQKQSPPASSSSFDLPVISPNYKPLPPRREEEAQINGYRKFGQTEDEALSNLISMNKKSKMTAVYSGIKKTGYTGPVPKLFDMCITVLQEHVDEIYECGGLNYEILKPILERANPQTLIQIEEHNPYLMVDTGELWEKFVKKHFPKEGRKEMESYREMFERCTEEREEKLNNLKVKVKDSYKRVESNYRQVKLAYVDTVAKPPRTVMRAQAKNGTALPVGHPIKRPMANFSKSGPSGGASSSSSSSSTSSSKRPKVAPLMSKTLKMARGMKGGFRR